MSTSKDKTNNNTKFFTRGGQITFHNLRMLLQINWKVGQWCLLIAVVVMGFILCAIIPTETFIAVYYLALAKGLSSISFSQHVFHMPWQGKTILLTPAAILSETYFQVQWQFFVSQAIKVLYIGGAAGLFSLIALTVWLIQRGRAQTTSQYIRGMRLGEAPEVAKEIRRLGKDSDIIIAEVPMAKRFEVQHTLIHGTVGSGKGQTFNQFLAHIKRRGDRAIIYDKGCVFTSIFYDAKKDVILNPFDARCANWALWHEALEGPDFENIAESLIPMQGETDPFWVSAARTIFSSVAYTMKADPDRSIDKLLKYILTAELHELASYLQGTAAAMLVSEKIEKTAISIRSVITTYLKSLRFLRGLNAPGKRAFSIREWIKQEADKQSGCLFISSNAEQHAALRPLISMWLSIASISLLSLPENYDRRMWFICDELPTLHKLTQLPETIAEVRKFGGCFVLGIQSFAQLEKVYGRAAAREIFDLLNTRFFFRSPSNEMARLVSQEIGEEEVDQSRENYSYGANTIRDGINLGSQRMTRPLVSAAEMMTLPDLTAYLRMPLDIPVCKLTMQYQARDKVAPSFVKRDIPQDPNLETRLAQVSGQANQVPKKTIPEGPPETKVQHESTLADETGSSELFMQEII